MSPFSKVTHFFDFLCYIAILFFVCSIESIFFSSSNAFIELDIWVIPLVFYLLHRSLLMALILSLTSAFLMSGFSGTPVYQILLALLSLLIFVFLFKSRSFVKGSAYLYLTSLLSLLVFYSSYLFFDYVFYSNMASINDLAVLSVIVLISPGFAFIMEPVLKMCDKILGVTYPFGFEA